MLKKNGEIHTSEFKYSFLIGLTEASGGVEWKSVLGGLLDLSCCRVPDSRVYLNTSNAKTGQGTKGDIRKCAHSQKKFALIISLNRAAMSDLELLGSVGHFCENELEMFKAYRQLRFFKKKEKLLSIGEVCKSIYFLKEGAIFQYKIKNENEKMYTDLHVEKEWILNYKSFINQCPSDANIEAFTDCEVVEIGIYAIHKLIENSSNFLQFNRVLGGLTERLDFFDQGDSPVEKYDFLVRHNPKIVQAFPLKTIASYLKISPETLSRVRSKY